MWERNMVSKKKIAFMMLLVAGANIFFSQELSGPQKQFAEKDFTQEIQWTKDKFAAEYEVEIQDENYKTVLTKRTKDTKLSFSMTHGSYRYRIFAFDLFGNRSQSTDWIEFEIVKAVKPVIEDFEKTEVFLEACTQLEIPLFVTGFSGDTKLYLLQYDRKKIFDAEIVSFEKNPLSLSGNSICKVKIPSAELSEQTYFFRAENPGGHIFEGGEFKIKYANRPVIVNFSPGIVYALKGAEVQLEVAVQNLDAQARFFLTDSAGKKIRCDVKNVRREGVTSHAALSFNALSDGVFSIRVENDGNFFDTAEGFAVRHAVYPRITDVKDGAYTVNSSKKFPVEFSALGITDSSSVRLVPKNSDGKSVPAKSLEKNGVEKYTAFFNSASLRSGEYALEIENAGGFKDSQGTFSLSVIDAVDVTVGLGVYSGTVILLYNDVLPDYTHSTFSLGTLAQVSVVPFKYPFGYFGFEFSVWGTYWQKSFDSTKVNIFSGIGTLELLYQKAFLNEKIRIKIGLGGGYSVFGHTVSDGSEREFAQCPVLKAGVACQWYPFKNMYVELGADYFHLFSANNYSGLIVPHLSAGARF